MEIKYLTYFQKALIDWNLVYSHDTIFLNEPLSLSQIEVLEKNIFTDPSQNFPIVLRELLYLTGGRCNFFDNGVNLSPKHKDTLNPELLISWQNKNPYFEEIKNKNEIDHYLKNRLIWTFLTVYESSNEFHFVYLDENDEDPIVYHFATEESFLGSSNVISETESLDYTSKGLRLSDVVIEMYEYSCNQQYRRPCYNENLSSYYTENSIPNSFSKNQNIFYSLISNRDVSGMKYFIDRGIDVTADNNQAIINTIATEDRTAFDLLLKSGANPLDQNEKILELAARENLNMLYHVLKKAHFTKGSLNRALVEVCARGFIGFDIKPIKYLIDLGAEINAFNSLGLQLAIRNEGFHLAGQLVSDFGANYKVNSGFVLLFKNYMGPDAQKIIQSEIQLLQPTIDIIGEHELDLRNFYGEDYDEKEFKKYPEEIKSELEKYDEENIDRNTHSKLTFWDKVKRLWS